ncbi:unnamed protein product [Polarella glacialis]|uniref:Uncharacterized protein n=1 Tax=Polarella glacialis TaxID=89957 RepID=A0A813DJS0_POLGL|nr:unnamed protein product [Polarella glacialis]
MDSSSTYRDREKEFRVQMEFDAVWLKRVPASFWVPVSAMVKSQRQSQNGEGSEPAGLVGADLANITYGLGLLEHPAARKPVGAACSEMSSRLQRWAEACSPQSLANTVYALALLKFKHLELLAALSAHVPCRVEEFKAQELSILVYSCALLRYRHDGLLHAACESTCQAGRLDTFCAQNISNMLYGVGLLNFRHNVFLHVTCNHTLARLGDFTSQGLANMVYALGLLRFRHDGLVQGLCVHLRTRGKAGEASGEGGGEEEGGEGSRSDNNNNNNADTNNTNNTNNTNIVNSKGKGKGKGHGQLGRGVLAEFLPQHLANTVYGLGLLGFKRPGSERIRASALVELPKRKNVVAAA